MHDATVERTTDGSAIALMTLAAPKPDAGTWRSAEFAGGACRRWQVCRLARRRSQGDRAEGSLPQSSTWAAEKMEAAIRISYSADNIRRARAAPRRPPAC